MGWRGSTVKAHASKLSQQQIATIHRRAETWVQVLSRHDLVIRKIVIKKQVLEEDSHLIHTPLREWLNEGIELSTTFQSGPSNSIMHRFQKIKAQAGISEGANVGFIRSAEFDTDLLNIGEKNYCVKSRYTSTTGIH